MVENIGSRDILPQREGTLRARSRVLYNVVFGIRAATNLASLPQRSEPPILAVPRFLPRRCHCGVLSCPKDCSDCVDDEPGAKLSRQSLCFCCQFPTTHVPAAFNASGSLAMDEPMQSSPQDEPLLNVDSRSLKQLRGSQNVLPGGKKWS